MGGKVVEKHAEKRAQDEREREREEWRREEEQRSEGGPGSISEDEEQEVGGGGKRRRKSREAGKRKRLSDQCPSPASIKRSSSGGARQLAFRIRNMRRVAVIPNSLFLLQLENLLVRIILASSFGRNRRVNLGPKTHR